MKTFDVSMRKSGRGRLVKVMLFANTVTGARDLVQADGYHVQNIVERRNPRRGFFRGILSLRQQYIVFKALSNLLKAQILIHDALRIFADGLESGRLKYALKAIALEIQNGTPNHLAFQQVGLFPEYVTGIIEAGTTAGELHKAFLSMAERAKLRAEFRGRIANILWLPALLAVILSFSWFQVQGILIPQMRSNLQQFHVTPGPEIQFFFVVSDVTIALWLPVLVIVLSSIATIFLSKRVRDLALAFLMAHLKTLRLIIQGLRQLEFFSVLEMLVSNNVKTRNAILTCATVMKGTPFEPQLRVVYDKMGQGLSLGDCITNYTGCDPRAAQLIKVGEKGDLADQLKLLVELYNEETKDRSKIFAEVLNIITLFLSVCVVAFNVLSMTLPNIFYATQLMKH